MWSLATLPSLFWMVFSIHFSAIKTAVEIIYFIFGWSFVVIVRLQSYIICLSHAGYFFDSFHVCSVHTEILEMEGKNAKSNYDARETQWTGLFLSTRKSANFVNMCNALAHHLGARSSVCVKLNGKFTQINVIGETRERINKNKNWWNGVCALVFTCFTKKKWTEIK